MRLRVKQGVAVLAVLAFSLPVWARTYKEELNADKDTNIGGTMLKAGSYELAADSTKKELQVLVEREGDGDGSRRLGQTAYEASVFDSDLGR